MTDKEYDLRLRHFLELQIMGELPKNSPIEALVLFYKWLRSEVCIIRDQDANHIPLIPNRTQKIFLVKAMEQAFKGQPIRIVVLKARKQGVSTLIQALFFFLCGHYSNRIAITIAHEGIATTKIFDITKLIGERYKLSPIKSIRQEMRFTSTNSLYYCRTAGGVAVGAGDTPNYLHMSEVAKWVTERGAETDTNATNAVPDTNPDTIIVYESTAWGRDPLFWKKFEDSSNPESPYDSMFSAWFFDDRCKLALRVTREQFRSSLTADEKEVVLVAHEYGMEITYEALQWRRQKIAGLTGGIEIFRREYPSTPEEAVAASEGIILPGLRRHIVDSLPFNLDQVPWEYRVGGIDYGYYDATVIIHAVLWDQILYIYDIYNKVEGLVQDHAAVMKEGYTYFIDPSAAAGRAELQSECSRRKLSCWIVAAPRKKKPGQTDFTLGELQDIRALLDSGRIKVLRKCHQQLLLETDNYMWNSRTGLPDDTRQHDTGHYDTIAALKYLIMGVSSSGGRLKKRGKVVALKHKESRRVKLRRV